MRAGVEMALTAMVDDSGRGDEVADCGVPHP